MDEICEWLNPRIPVEYGLIFLVLFVVIVIGMLGKNEQGEEAFEL